MFNIISIHCLLQFLLFIYIIPIYITIESQIQFFFFNGVNVIRCSDEQVQVYQPKSDPNKFLSEIISCNSISTLYNLDHVGYLWKRLEIICSSGLDQVHEEQFIGEAFHSSAGVIKQLPRAKGQLCQSHKTYDLQVEYSDEDRITTIKSNDQPVDDAYYNKNTNPKERKIYIWFPGHPIICRIIFTSEKDNPCENKRQVEDVKYACYYNPGADYEPTVKEMEAEFEQIEDIDDRPDSEAYVLNLKRPEISPDDPSDNPCNPKHDSKQKDKKKIILPNKSKTAKNSSVPKIIGIILGILLLVVLIGGIGFYMIRKNRLNNSSTPLSSTNIEKGGDKKDSSSVVISESSQSLADDTNSEIAKNEPSKQDKPNIELQKGNANKQQRTGAGMAFNDDI